MLFITHRLQAYFLKITPGRWLPFTSMHCYKRVWKLPCRRLRRSSSIAATSSTMACLNSWIVMIRLRNTRSFRNPHRKKSGTVRSGDRAGQAMLPKLRTQVTRVARCDWPCEMASSPLPFPFPPTTTSSRAGQIFKFEMCQSAPGHPVFLFAVLCLILCSGFPDWPIPSIYCS
jgi:hypothetical protein